MARPIPASRPRWTGVLDLPLVALFLVTCALSAPASAADWDDCGDCHDEAFMASFAGSVHALIGTHETPGIEPGCGSCHGATAAHVRSGDPDDIRSLSHEPADDVSRVCTSCHAGRHLSAWLGSEHQLSGVGCTDCHAIHVSADAPRWPKGSPERCYECHRDVQAELSLPSHHPVREGHLTCLSCHDPHGGFDRGLKTWERGNELCLGCHQALQGPFIFEHAPVVEDCGICHAPHGAVADNLLLQNEPFLCLQCHELHFHAGQDAREETVLTEASPGFGNWPAGTSFGNPYGTSGYRVAFTTRCSQCHSKIHGSDLPSSTSVGHGRSLTR